MISTKFVPYEMKTCTITVYSYEGKTLKGTVANPYFEEPVVFENAIQLVLLIDELQDAICFPHESMRTRSFADSENPKPAREKRTADEAGMTGRSPLASFKLNIMFRQNASWQGSIVWIDNRTESQFRSLLELIVLLDSALTAGQ
jgi:hypothetical protein